MRNSSEILSNETCQVLKENKHNYFKAEAEQDSRQITIDHNLRMDHILNLNKVQNQNRRRSARFGTNPLLKNSDKQEINMQTASRKPDNSVQKKEVPQENKKFSSTEIERFLDSNTTILIMSVVTVYILFENDVNDMLPPSVDLPFNIVNLFCLVLLTCDFLLCCIGKQKYMFSFFFWIDLLSVITTISEVSWIFDPIIEEIEYQL